MSPRPTSRDAAARWPITATAATAEAIGRNYLTEVPVLADARTALETMLEAAGGVAQPDRSAWIAQVRGYHREWEETYRDIMASDAEPMRPERLARELTTFLPDDAILAVDTGHAGMWMAQFLDLTSPAQSYLRSAGHLGWAFPAALGAKCAAPDRPVFSFTGDAGLYYHLGELETAVRRGINAIVVVNDNVGGTQSKRGFDRAYGGESTEQAKEMWTYVDADLVRIAESVGAVGIRVDKPAHLQGAFQRAVEANAPVVLDVRTAADAVAPLAVTP